MVARYPPQKELIKRRDRQDREEIPECPAWDKESLEFTPGEEGRSGSQAKKRIEDLFSGLLKESHGKDRPDASEETTVANETKTGFEINEWRINPGLNADFRSEPVDLDWYGPRRHPLSLPENFGSTEFEADEFGGLATHRSIEISSPAESPQPFPELAPQTGEWIAAPTTLALTKAETLSPNMLLELVDQKPQRRWNEDELLLVEQVADQLTLALENAQLFEQTQQARDALQISVRYQKSVAEAVSILSERGYSAISEVLQVLGEAAQVSRATVFEIEVDLHGPYFRSSSEWHAPEVDSRLVDPEMHRIAGDWLKPWIDQIDRDGHLTADIHSAPLKGGALVKTLGAKTILQFIVRGQHGAPRCLSFEQTDFVRTWSSDEIAALDTAASALANTILRENLFNQLQVNLSETEAQYQASAQINSANSPDEILSILRQFTILGHNHVSNVSICLFDIPWTKTEKPAWLAPAAVWSCPSQPEFLSERTANLDWLNEELLFNSEGTTSVFDIESDPNFNRQSKSQLIETFKTKSLLSVPLNVSGRWIGSIIALFNQTTGFLEREIRRLESLSGQAAVALESQRLLSETRQRNEELLVMNQVSSAVSRTLELDQVLNEILERALEMTGFDGGLISYVHPESQKLILAVACNLPSAMSERLDQTGLGGTPCDLVYQSGITINISDLTGISEVFIKFPDEVKAEWPEERVSKAFAGLKAMGYQAYLGVPLMVKRHTPWHCLFIQSVDERASTCSD